MVDMGLFCVEPGGRTYARWDDAVDACFEQERRLCDLWEYRVACSADVLEPVAGAPAEWTVDATGDDLVARARLDECRIYPGGNVRGENTFRCCVTKW